MLSEVMHELRRLGHPARVWLDAPVYNQLLLELHSHERYSNTYAHGFQCVRIQGTTIQYTRLDEATRALWRLRGRICLEVPLCS